MNTLESVPRFVIVGARSRLFQGAAPVGVRVCHDGAELAEALPRIPARVTWISLNQAATELLLKRWIESRRSVRESRLITLSPPRPESIPALTGLVGSVHGLVPGFRWLPARELAAVIAREDAGERLIGGGVDLKSRSITLLSGDMNTIVVPFSSFPPSGDGTKPDFEKISLADHGRTLALGAYEASADAILYEHVPAYRRKLNAQRRLTDRSFGAALRRLRKQRGLRLADFAPLSAKEIGRIERNEVEKPRDRTLQVIARRLGVGADEIGDF